MHNMFITSASLTYGPRLQSMLFMIGKYVNFLQYV